jgi:L-threonylcarbamoyladenylate synthase
VLRTRLLSSSPPDLSAAAEILRGGGLVAFPTETVYGLGADGINARAVARIFEVKGRPADNPLILHLSGIAALDPLVRRIPLVAARLSEFFWPGPLTLVLERSALVPEIVSAGLPTVAVRVPDHAVALGLIREAGRPLAAPSANRSGHPSPTRAAHVKADLDGAIEAIVDGGACRIGVESTVLDLTSEPFRVLRPGGISPDELAAVIGYVPEVARRRHEASPGTRHHHYRPRCRVTPFPPAVPPTPRAGDGIISLTVPATECRFSRRMASAESYARDLYALFRAADEAGVECLYCELPSPEGIGLALRDRLRRAAGESG